MTDWLELCRAAVVDVKTVLAEMPGREARERPVGQGEGGDVTAALDEAAETAALRHFELADVRIVSEEVGFKGDGRYTLVVDPIDGSQNAERGIPYFCLCVAVAEGDTVGDVFFGYVYDFGANEEWTATRGEGALLNGGPILDGPRDYIQFMSLEATRAQLVSESLAKLHPLTDRVRVMGAQALTYCHMAAGRTDAVVCLKPSRSVDFAAAQLIVRERGFAIELIDDPPLESAPLDLKARSRVVAAGRAELVRAITDALGPLPVIKRPKAVPAEGPRPRGRPAQTARGPRIPNSTLRTQHRQRAGAKKIPAQMPRRRLCRGFAGGGWAALPSGRFLASPIAWAIEIKGDKGQMKLWALILAAGSILAFAAPAADAASSPARPGGAVLHTNVVFRDPLHGQTAFVRPLDRPRSSATNTLVASGRLHDLLTPRPSVWSQPLPPLPWGLFWIF